MCHSGLHASKRIIDALKYAPGMVLCRVELEGALTTEHHKDEYVALRRRILWRERAGHIMEDSRRKCALKVLANWAAPEGVKEFLKSGDVRLGRQASSLIGNYRIAPWFAGGLPAAQWDAERLAVKATRMAIDPDWTPGLAEPYRTWLIAMTCADSYAYMESGDWKLGKLEDWQSLKAEAAKTFMKGAENDLAAMARRSRP
jgi:hypothetical protein